MGDEMILHKMFTKWHMMLRLKARKLVPLIADLDLVVLGVSGEEEIERQTEHLASAIKDILRISREATHTIRSILDNYNTSNTDNGLPAFNTMVSLYHTINVHNFGNLSFDSSHKNN